MSFDSRPDDMGGQEPKSRLRVLAPDYYGMAFVTPRQSRHDVVRRPYKAPWRRLWRPLDALAIGLQAGDCDVVHSYNRIPLTRKPWIVTFESWLPRTLAARDLGLRRYLMRRLARENCRRVIAMSDYARNVLTLFNEDSPYLDEVLRKTEIVYPNVPLRATEPKRLGPGPIRVLFVGNDFAQKGGVASVRLAKSARRAGVPVEVHIVSSMRYGKAVFADSPTPGVYDEDIALMEGENVTHHGVMPNDEVIELMRRCDFLLLTSLDDTFGFSAIEALSVGTPAIVSNVCALPEVVQEGVNGTILQLPLDRYRKWTELNRRDWKALNAAYDLFAERALAFLRDVADRPESYESMSAAAAAGIRERHEACKIGARLDAIYEEAAA